MNILLIMADELSTWGLGCYDSRQKHTPNIDALVASGTLFSAAYTPSPICVPTRAAIACGRYLHEIGYWSSAEAYDGRVASWGHRLREACIEAVSIGKLHYRNGTDDTGFERLIEPIHIPDGIGWVRGLLRKPLASYDATAEMAEMIGPGETDYTRFDRRVAAEAETWLTDPGRRQRPWCAFVSFLSPHFPLIVPAEFYNLYDPTVFESEADPLPGHQVMRQVAEFFDHDTYFTPRTRGIARAGYFGLCAFMDAQVGQVLRALEASGQADETLVIVTSDHGEMLGHRAIWGKSTMYEDSARIPLLMTGPGVAAERRDDPVSLIDLAPTIAEATGMADPSKGFSGQSLFAQTATDRTVLSEYHDGGSPFGITMVRWGQWKYVHYAEGHSAELFDLAADPQESHNRASDRPDIVSEACRRLARFMDPEEVNARAHADQARLVEQLGGRENLLAEPQWNFTPADSR